MYCRRIYCVEFFLVVVIFIMRRLGSTLQLCTKEDDDQLSERVVLGCASTKVIFPSAHTDTHNEIMVPSKDSIRQLVCHVIDKK